MTQFPKLVGAFCATLFCAGTLAVLAEDNAAQAAARAELLREFQQTPASQTNDATAPVMAPASVISAPVAATTAVSAPATTPPPQAAPAAATPVEVTPAPSSGDNPAQAAARALLLQQWTATPASSNPAASTPATTAPAASMAATAPDVDAARQAQADAKAKAAADAKAAREAKAAAMAEAARNAAAAPTGVTAPKPSSAIVGGRQMTVPAPPISADQAARLQALDAKYTANQISPADYFKQREAILSGQ